MIYGVMHQKIRAMTAVKKARLLTIYCLGSNVTGRLPFFFRSDAHQATAVKTRLLTMLLFGLEFVEVTFLGLSFVSSSGDNGGAEETLNASIDSAIPMVVCTRRFRATAVKKAKSADDAAGGLENVTGRLPFFRSKLLHRATAVKRFDLLTMLLFECECDRKIFFFRSELQYPPR
jgi:hypothetical protein